MKIRNCSFVTSATSYAGYPEGTLPEIAFIGRSNVGKSSIINAITERKSLAKVSNTPGRTRLVNFFILNDSMYLVDLPGYGYARVSKSSKEVFGKIVEEYFRKRKNLSKVVLLVDARHKPTEDDVTMYEYLKHYGFDIQIVATKLDKLKRNEIRKNENIIKTTLGLGNDDKIIMYSSSTKENHELMMDTVFGEFSEEEGQK